MLSLTEIASSCKHKLANTSANCDKHRPRQPHTDAQAVVDHHRKLPDEMEQSNLDPRGVACVDDTISR